MFVEQPWRSTAEPDAPATEAEVLRRGVALLADRLPRGWSACRVDGDDARIDAILEVTGADGTSATLIAEAGESSRAEMSGHSANSSPRAFAPSRAAKASS